MKVIVLIAILFAVYAAKSEENHDWYTSYYRSPFSSFSTYRSPFTSSYTSYRRLYKHNEQKDDNNNHDWISSYSTYPSYSSVIYRRPIYTSGWSSWKHNLNQEE